MAAWAKDHPTRLFSDKDEKIRIIGNICCDYIQKQKAKALEKEREEDIYGRY